jgi:hypothetical protein
MAKVVYEGRLALAMELLGWRTCGCMKQRQPYFSGANASQRAKSGSHCPTARTFSTFRSSPLSNLLEHIIEG